MEVTLSRSGPTITGVVPLVDKAQLVLQFWRADRKGTIQRCRAQHKSNRLRRGEQQFTGADRLSLLTPINYPHHQPAFGQRVQYEAAKHS